MKKDRVVKVIIGIVSAFLFAFIYFIFHKITGLGIPCPIHELLHLNCPGCGISRMFFSMFELNFYQAFRFNPLLFCLLPFAIVLAIDLMIAYLYDRPNKIFSKIPMYCWVGLLIVIIVYGIIRNIGPFTYLSPTEIVMILGY